MARSRRWYWIHGSAAAVSALLIGALIVVEFQRSELKDTNSNLSNELESAKAKIKNAEVKINSLESKVGAYADTVNNQRRELDSLGLLVYEKNDSIIELNSALEECQKKKKKKTTSTKGVQTAVVRQQQGPSTVVRVVDTCGNMRADVRLNSSTNDGNIVVNTDNSCASVILEGSSSNSGNILIGNGNVINVINGQNGRNVSVNDTVTQRAQNDSIICTVRWVQTTARVR